MTLETQRLNFRLLEPEDKNRIKLLTHDRFIADSLNIPSFYTVEDAEEWVMRRINKTSSDIEITLAIILKSNNSLIGTITLAFEDDKTEADLAYWLGLAYWNKGYAQEAVKFMLNYGFNDLHLKKVTADHFLWNTTSAKLLKKVGMHYKETIEKHISKRDRIEKAAVWEIHAFNI